jgi:hypothetical protein
MPITHRLSYERPPCPKCQMGMIVVDGFKADFERRTFECLKCGHLEAPEKSSSRIYAA